MVKKVKDKISKVLTEYFGCKPKSLGLVLALAIIILLAQIFVLGYAQFKYNQILEKMDKKADVNVYIDPYLQFEPSLEYLPVIVTNTGDLPLYNLTIGIQSCVMKNISGEYFEFHRIPYILPYSEHLIRFGNDKTINDFKRANCTPSSKYPRPSISVNPFSNDTEISTTTTCGWCYYTIIIQSDDGLINRTFRKWCRSPVDITIESSPEGR